MGLQHAEKHRGLLIKLFKWRSVFKANYKVCKLLNSGLQSLDINPGNLQILISFLFNLILLSISILIVQIFKLLIG